MKLRIFLLCTLLPVSIKLFGQSNYLFKIIENGKIGYINQKGIIKIPAKFNNGNDFSEGLAAVRLNGRYGFIDSTGSFVIPPKYDWATSFSSGITCAYLNKNPHFFDKNGNVLLGEALISVQIIDNQNVVVLTKSNHCGLYNSKLNKLLIDTVYEAFRMYKHGIKIVTIKDKSIDKENQKYQCAVIDSLGNFIVDFGKYDVINHFVEGFARVEKNTDGYKTEGVIDSKGNLLFQKNKEDDCYIKKDFYNGLAVISLNKDWKFKNKGAFSSYSNRYEGYINLKGEIVLNDTNYNKLKNFSSNRTFIHEKSGEIKMVNTRFQTVGDEVFDDIQDDGFKNGLAIVNKNDNWGIIDTNGKFVVEPKFESIHKVGVMDGYFFFSQDFGLDKLYGVSTLNGKTLILPIIQEFDQSGFVNGILKAIIDNRLTYIDKLGNVIWQEKKAANITLMPLNIDCMNRGYFYAYSRPDNKYKSGFEGGFGESRNLPKIITSENFPKKRLSVTVDLITKDTFQNKFIGYKVFVANKSKTNIAFNAQDSRLKMKVQALDENGIWRDIEYLPNSWCGNSYHTLTLNKDNYWTFTTPKYGGEIKTRLRIELRYIDPNDKSEKRRDQKEITIYSNEYEGGINPAQFWNKTQYISSGLMDPYND